MREWLAQMPEPVDEGEALQALIFVAREFVEQGRLVDELRVTWRLDNGAQLTRAAYRTDRGRGV